jgi:acylphosphatase
MEPENNTRRRFIVRGTVQGVGFRYWTIRQGGRLGLRGTVRNLTDGSVEVEVQGLDAAVEQLRRLLLRGPTHAEVREILELPPGDDPLPEHFGVAF